TPEEYEKVRVEVERLKTADLAGFLARQLGQSVLLYNGWENEIAEALRFYEAARKRELNFRRYLEIDGPSVIVTGGFHREAVMRFLEENQISYAVITPRITRDDPIHLERYEFLMSGKMYAFEGPFLSRPSASFAVEQPTHPYMAKEFGDEAVQEMVE